MIFTPQIIFVLATAEENSASSIWVIKQSMK